MKTLLLIALIAAFVPVAGINQFGPLPIASDNQRKGVNVIQDDLEIEIVDTEPITYIGMEATVDESDTEVITETMTELYGQLMEYAKASGTETIGAPIAVFKSFGKYNIELICGLPVNEGYIIHHESIEVGETLGGKAVKATHRGNYKGLPFTHKKVNEYIEKNNLRVVGYPYEIYITHPVQEPDSTQWVTEIYYPLGGE